MRATGCNLSRSQTFNLAAWVSGIEAWASSFLFLYCGLQCLERAQSCVLVTLLILIPDSSSQRLNSSPSLSHLYKAPGWNYSANTHLCSTLPTSLQSEFLWSLPCLNRKGLCVCPGVCTAHTSSAFWRSLECQMAMPICALFAYPPTIASQPICFLCPSTVLRSVDTILNTSRHSPSLRLIHISVEEKGQINVQDKVIEYADGRNSMSVRLGPLWEGAPELRLKEGPDLKCGPEHLLVAKKTSST